MSKKFWVVVKREYITRAKSKGFIIGTLLFPVILALIFGGIFIFGALFKPSTKSYVIIDSNGNVAAPFQAMLADTLSSGMPRYRFILHDPIPSDLETALSDYQKKILKKEIEGLLVIPQDITESREVRFSARSVGDFEEQQKFAGVLSRIVADMRLKARGLPVDKIREEMAQSRVSLKSRQVTEEGEIEKSGLTSFIMAYILTYVMLLLMMTYGQTLMRSVIEEKSQRITETIISSIRPRELMLGKLIGICALGLTQLVVFGLMIIGLVQFAGPLLERIGIRSGELISILSQIHFSGPLFGFLILFFILGYTLFSSLFAAIGAMVNTEDEGQQFQMPVMFLIIMGYFIMFTVARNPDTSMAFWASLFPIFAPFVMFSRIAVSDPVIPSGTYLSLAILLLTNIGLIYLIGKIYRVGILMYGKKPSIKEAIKWIRY